MALLLRENQPPPEEVQFETIRPLRRALKKLLINPVANHAPAGLFRALLRLGKSELAEANWANPGGWKSMVISYSGKPRQIADKLLVKAGTIPMALRNRKRLAAALLARLIDESPIKPAHVLCLGAGPGRIILDALALARSPGCATLVDINSDAFDYGQELARQAGLAERVRYIQSDVRNLKGYLDNQPHIVKMLGICEYLSDEQILAIAKAAAELMPDQGPVVLNSLSDAHGTDKFFRRVFGLHMIHRSAHHVAQIMSEAGFGEFVAHPEPLGVYQVIVGRKVQAHSNSPVGGVRAQEPSRNTGT